MEYKCLPKHKHEVTAMTTNPLREEAVILFYADGQVIVNFMF